MARSQVTLSLTSPIATHGWDFGQRALGVLYDGDPRLKPERIGLDDTDMRKKHPCDTIEQVRPLWAPGAQDARGMPRKPVPDLFWRRSKALRAEGALGHSWINQKGTLLPARVYVWASYAKDFDYLGVFCAWCDLYRPTMGVLHYFGPHETPASDISTGTTEDEIAQSKARGMFYRGSFGALRDQNAMNMGYATFFGEDTLPQQVRAELGRNDLTVEARADGHLVTLAPSLDDVKTDFATFSRKRALAKSIIGPDHFVIRDEPAL